MAREWCEKSVGQRWTSTGNHLGKAPETTPKEWCSCSVSFSERRAETKSEATDVSEARVASARHVGLVNLTLTKSSTCRSRTPWRRSSSSVNVL